MLIKVVALWKSALYESKENRKKGLKAILGRIAQFRIMVRRHERRLRSISTHSQHNNMKEYLYSLGETTFPLLMVGKVMSSNSKLVPWNRPLRLIYRYRLWKFHEIEYGTCLSSTNSPQRCLLN
ncbi:hypothetical protein AVEN_256514-1 [Araneus ventricosus]|uniref:Uncharacterized protein n=1 Tax=Araneus ventricosus TaxID=182803 RepID=A0A4Y2TX36_ARAVE|nr:hypothetical protein AVEN_256514-1 [Araneus ventricosus]